MSEKKIEVKVKDVMSTPVVTVNMNTSMDEVASLMIKENVGSVIVVDELGNPIGIITESDLVKKVVAKNVFPKQVKALEVMSKPLFTVSKEEELTEVAKKMSRLNVKRFPVMFEGKLVGIISSKDILEITPHLIDVIMEKSEFFPVKTEKPLIGNCELCGNWCENLKFHEGKFLCEDCLIDLTKQD
ncbi:MAG: CBS domain-containing protein [Candidatus Bathyarchaeia archaeon]|nr:CBS domain-containing protein [Candidatus Bathyarchaeota archaeon]